MITSDILSDETLDEYNRGIGRGFRVIKFYLPTKSENIGEPFKVICTEPDHELCELKEHIYYVDDKRYVVLSIYISSKLYRKSENRDFLLNKIIDKHCAYLYSYATRGKTNDRC